MVAVNSAEDYLNPPSLGIIDRDIKRVKNGRYVLVPASDQTRGHFTVLQANLWESNLTDLLKPVRALIPFNDAMARIVADFWWLSPASYPSSS